MADSFETIRRAISDHQSNSDYAAQGLKPLFTASSQTKIVVIGQAPGIKAQTTGIPWNDASGSRLIEWLGVDAERFYDPRIFAHVPMDFYYPGKGVSGDLPPRKEFAPLWHPPLLELMPQIEMTVLVGQYAQKYYLQQERKQNLTETVRNYSDYLPEYFPIVHPSPLNFRWHAKNSWFQKDLLPLLQARVARIIHE